VKENKDKNNANFTLLRGDIISPDPIHYKLLEVLL